MRVTTTIAILGLIGALKSSYVFAMEKDIKRASATAFISFDYGMTTHKSEFVDSNDTGYTLGYDVGFHAGSERSIGVLLRNDSSAINFELNSSSMSSGNRDIIIRYRWGNFFLGAVLANTTLEATRADEADDAEIDAVGTGFGGHFATVWGIGRSGSWYLDSMFNTYDQTREANQIDMEFGTRMDIDTGVNFFLTRDVVDLMFGYRYRTATYSATGTDASDTISTTYLGLRFNAIF